MPTTAPMPATSRLSVSICRTRRRREAPSDERTASSLARSVARANCMFITLTQEISSTPTQKPSIVHSVPRSGRGVKVSSSGCTWPVLNCLFVLRIRRGEPLRERRRFGVGLVERDAVLDQAQHRRIDRGDRSGSVLLAGCDKSLPDM